MSELIEQARRAEASLLPDLARSAILRLGELLDALAAGMVVGATSVVRRARASTTPAVSWIRALLERRPARVVTVAMANKTARIAWAVLARGQTYHAPAMA